MTKLFRFFWYLSLLLFLGVLLYVYAAFSQEVRLQIADADYSYSKEQFFYGSLALFAAVNVVFYYASKVVDKAGKSQGSLKGSSEIKIGLDGLKVVVNITLISLMVFLGASSRSTAGAVSQYGWIVYIGPVLFIVWLIYAGFLTARRSKF
jgi:uncharacterized membrane protein